MFKELTGLIAKIRSQGSFARNISIASSWNLVGVLIQFLLSPIVTRLYTPAEYGVFAIFNSIVLNVSMINTLRYSDSIILATGNKQRNNAVALTLLVAAMVALLSGIAILIFHRALRAFIGEDLFSAWIYLMPLSIFMAGLIEILILINIRSNRIFHNGLSGFMMNASSRGFNIIYGISMPAKSSGLIAGELLGKIVAVANLLAHYKFPVKRLKSIFQSIDSKSVLALARIYRHFPLYNLPSNLLISLSGHAPIYFLQFQYSSSIVGAYALSASLMEIINRLIPYSISSVFLPKAMELKRESIDVLARSAYRLFLYLVIGAFLIFGTLTLIGRQMFPWMFGEKWAMAGSFTSLLSITYAFNFISLALLEIFKVIQKQKIFLTTTFAAVAMKIGVIICGLFLNLDISFLLWGYSIAGAIGSLIQIFFVFTSLKYNQAKVLMLLTLLLSIMILLAFLINF